MVEPWWENCPKTIQRSFERTFWGRYSNLLLETGLLLCHIRSSMLLCNEVLKFSKEEIPALVWITCFFSALPFWWTFLFLMSKLSFQHYKSNPSTLVLSSTAAKKSVAHQLCYRHLDSCRLILDSLFYSSSWHYQSPANTASPDTCSMHLSWFLLDPLCFLHIPLELRGQYLHTGGDSSVISSTGSQG